MIFKGDEIVMKKHSSLINKDEFDEITIEDYISQLSFQEKEEFVKEFSREKLAVNIHFMLSEETYERAFEVVSDIAADPRLKGFNAIVFLAHKAKGRNKTEFSSVKNKEKYQKLISFCEDRHINYGFDSCSAPVFFKTFEGTDRYNQMSLLGEACESTLFSSYINADGKFFPCSFNEGEGDWTEGLDVLTCTDFAKDIWFNEKTIAFRNKLMETTRGCLSCPSQKFCRTCPTFEVTSCHKE